MDCGVPMPRRPQMRIVFFQRAPAPGFFSIERVFDEVGRALPHRFAVTRAECPTPFHSRWWLFRGLRRARLLRADINHVTGDVHYAAIGLPKDNTIVTVHDLNRLDELRGLRKRLYYWIYFALPLRRCRIITTISSATRDRVVHLVADVSDKITVIPDCVPCGFKPTPKAFDSDRPRILQVGTKPNKNLERVAAALRGLPCTLHVIGHLTRPQQECLDHLGVHWENSFDLSDADMSLSYQDADIVTFVSLSEGFGLPILEAQAVGRPVITSDLAPMNETSGGAACLVNPYEVDDIRAGILRLIKDRPYRERLVEGGFANVARFAPEVVAQQYSCLYDELRAQAIAAKPQ